MGENFKLENLKSGFLVECENGNQYLVVQNTQNALESVFVRRSGHVNSNEYTDDLKHRCSSEYDIVKVFGLTRYCHTLDDLLTTENRGLLWERTTVKTMTLTEIEDILGYKIEIVSEV